MSRVSDAVSTMMVTAISICLRRNFSVSFCRTPRIRKWERRCRSTESQRGDCVDGISQTSRPGHINREERGLGKHWIIGLMRPISGLEFIENGQVNSRFPDHPVLLIRFI